MRRPTVGAAVPAARTGMAVEIRRTWRRNSEEQQKTSLTLRQGLRRYRSGTQANRFLERPLRGLGRDGPQGTAAPTIGLVRRAAGDCGPYRWGWARRAAGDCRPYHWLGGVGCRDGPQGTAAPTVGWGRGGRQGLPPLPLVGGGAGGRGLPPLPWGWCDGPQGTAAPTIGLGGVGRAKPAAKR